MEHRIGMAVVCLHVSAALYLLAGAMFPLFPADDRAGVGMPLAVGMFAFCLVLAAGIEWVAYGLGRRKFWAWVAALCVFTLYLPSLFFPLGALGLWGLLDGGSRAAFGIGGPGDRNGPDDASHRRSI